MDCIARVCSGMKELYCNMVGLKGCFSFFVLQYTLCIVARKGLGVENCVAIQFLYCDQQ